MDNKNNQFDLEKLLQILTVSDQEFVKSVIHKTIREKYSTNSLETIWYDESNAASFWILLVNGINNVQEVAVIKQLLYWKEFFARTFAKVRCIQSYDQYEFSLVVRKFKIKACPCIIFSDGIDFESYAIVKTEMIQKIADKKEGIVDLCNQIHQAILSGNDIKTIAASMSQKQILNAVNQKETFKQVLSQSNFEAFFKLAFDCTDFKEDKQIFNLLHIVSGEYQLLANEELLGVISSEEINRRKNTIRWKISKLIDDVPIA